MLLLVTMVALALVLATNDVAGVGLVTVGW